MHGVAGAKYDARAQMIRSGRPCPFDVLLEWIEAQNASCVIGVPPCQPTVATSYFQYVLASEIHELMYYASLVAFWIDGFAHLLKTGSATTRGL